NYTNTKIEFYISYIHETEIKMVKSKWSYKKFMVKIRNRNELRGSGSKRITRVETDYEGRNELRGSKQITRVETNYEGRNELRGSKRIIKLETNYEGRNELRNYVSIREIISYLLNIIYTNYKLKKTKKRKLIDYSSKLKKNKKKKKINELLIQIYIY